MSEQPIRFYFDFISHNAYLAWSQIHKLAGAYKRKVEPVPVLFAAMLDHYGQKGPAEMPAKSLWMIRDVLRKAEQLKLPLRPPASHPFNPLLALRVAGLEMPRHERRTIIDGLFRAAWAESRDISDPDVVGAVLTYAGADAAALLERANQQAAKNHIRTTTQEAIEQGIFGVPSVQADGQLFWGYDDLRYLEMFLDGRDPYDPSRLEPWLRVQPSARRRSDQ